MNSIWVIVSKMISGTYFPPQMQSHKNLRRDFIIISIPSAAVAAGMKCAIKDVPANLGRRVVFSSAQNSLARSTALYSPSWSIF